jgi:hypothetical protein
MTIRRWLAVTCALALVACKGRTTGAAGGSGSGAGSAAAGQSMAEALAIMCGKGPPPPDVSDLLTSAARTEVLGDWLDARITNPHVRALIATFADDDRADHSGRVRRAAADAGVTGCEPLALFGPRPLAGAGVPDVGDPAGTAELNQELPFIALTRSAVIVDGKSVTPIADGAVAEPARVAPMVSALVAVLTRRDGYAPTTFTIAADRELPMATLSVAIDAVRAAGAARFHLAVGVGAASRILPIEIPRRAFPTASVIVTVLDAGLGLEGPGGGVRALPPGEDTPGAIAEALRAATKGTAMPVIVQPGAGVTVDRFAAVVAVLARAADATGARLATALVLVSVPDPRSPAVPSPP